MSGVFGIETIDVQQNKSEEREKVTIVATARHMAESVYWVLTRREYYSKGGVDG